MNSVLQPSSPLNRWRKYRLWMNDRCWALEIERLFFIVIKVKKISYSPLPAMSMTYEQYGATYKWFELADQQSRNVYGAWLYDHIGSNTTYRTNLVGCNIDFSFWLNWVPCGVRHEIEITHIFTMIEHANRKVLCSSFYSLSWSFYTVLKSFKFHISFEKMGKNPFTYIKFSLSNLQ